MSALKSKLITNESKNKNNDVTLDPGIIEKNKKQPQIGDFFKFN